MPKGIALKWKEFRNWGFFVYYGVDIDDFYEKMISFTLEDKILYPRANESYFRWHIIPEHRYKIEYNVNRILNNSSISIFRYTKPGSHTQERKLLLIVTSSNGILTHWQSNGTQRQFIPILQFFETL